jgi:hypothetical protein
MVDLKFFIVHDVPDGGLQIMKINYKVLLGLVLGGVALALRPIAEAGAAELANYARPFSHPSISKRCPRRIGFPGRTAMISLPSIV